MRSVGVSPTDMSADIDTGEEMADTDLGGGDVDTGAGPAPAATPTPGAEPAGGL